MICSLCVANQKSNVLPLQALWTKSGDEVVYPCHAIIISMNISSGQQRFFTGHTDKVGVKVLLCATALSWPGAVVLRRGELHIIVLL